MREKELKQPLRRIAEKGRKEKEMDWGLESK